MACTSKLQHIRPQCAAAFHTELLTDPPRTLMVLLILTQDCTQHTAEAVSGISSLYDMCLFACLPACLCVSVYVLMADHRYTILAPTNEAFDRLATSLGLAGAEQLLVPGQKDFLTEVGC